MGPLLKNKLKKIIYSVLMALIGAITVMPFVFMVSAAFKHEAAVFVNPLRIIPEKINYNSFSHLFSHDMYFKWYLNTIIMVSITLALRFFLVTTAAYAFSRLNFKGRDLIFIVLISTMMVTPDTTVVARYLVFDYLNLIDSQWTVILTSIVDVFFIFLLRQFFITIPHSLSEAAIIDGCSHFKVYYSIILPLSKPVLITMILFTFIWAWNEFVSAYVFISSREKQMVSVGLQYFQGEVGPKYSLQMAAASLAVIPCILIFAFTQKYFVQGMIGSGIKG